MLASAWRSLIVASFGNEGEAPKVLQRSPLGAGSDAPPAVSLAWDEDGSKVVVAVSSDKASAGSQVYFLEALPSRGSSPLQAIVPISRDCGIADLCVQGSTEDQKCLVVAACSDGSMCLIDASGRAARIQRMYKCFRVAGAAVEMARDLQCFACGSAAGQVVLQPLGEDKPQSTLVSSACEKEAAISCLRFSPKRPEILAGSDGQGRIQVWDTATLRRVMDLPAHEADARSLSFSRHNEALLISAGADAMLKFWDIKNGKPINEIPVESSLESLSYHLDGFRLAAGTVDGIVLLYDLRKMKEPEPLQRLAVHKDDGCKGLRAMAWGPRQPPYRADLEMSASPRSTPQSHPPSSLGHSSAGSAEASPPKKNPLAGTGPTQAAPGGQSVPRGMAPLDTHSGSFAGSKVTRDLASEFEDSSGLQELMNKLSSRKASSESQAQAAAPPRRLASAPSDVRVTERPPAAPGSVSDAARRPPLPLTQPLTQPLPSTPLNSQRTRRLPPTGTPADDDRPSAREPVSFHIGNTPQPAEAAGPACSPPSAWYSSDSEPRLLSERQRNRPGGTSSAGATPLPTNPATAATVAAIHRPRLVQEAAGSVAVDGDGVPGADLPEVLRPWLEELRRDICREVREAQYCMLEQNFRLHADLRRDVEDLRAEVQVLRGEMQALL